ncbi:MAG: LacI family DNA-binding transcriptional regulator [Acidobacteriaceae bacterium]|nr:LacI family DNA-binding transcriptional regulator [Acidobacteriaceae bacterium]
MKFDPEIRSEVLTAVFKEELPSHERDTKITMWDVARLAVVSASTVSAVSNGTALVGEERARY